MATNLSGDIDSIYAQLKSMYEAGSMPANTYFKGLVALAFEYAVENKMNEAVSLLDECPADYFSLVMPAQMAIDKTYCTVAYDLAEMLNNAGVVADGFVLTTTRTSQA